MAIFIGLVFSKPFLNKKLGFKFKYRNVEEMRKKENKKYKVLLLINNTNDKIPTKNKSRITVADFAINNIVNKLNRIVKNQFYILNLYFLYYGLILKFH